MFRHTTTSKSEIYKLYQCPVPVLPCEHDVLELEVPVDHVPAVDISDSRRELGEHPPPNNLRKAATILHVLQEVLMQELHDDVKLRVRLEPLDAANDVRVVEAF